MESAVTASASGMSIVGLLIICVLALLALAVAAGIIVLIVCLARRKKNAPKVKEEDVIFVE